MTSLLLSFGPGVVSASPSNSAAAPAACGIAQLVSPLVEPTVVHAVSLLDVGTV